jgi:hypothetical protein
MLLLLTPRALDERAARAHEGGFHLNAIGKVQLQRCVNPRPLDRSLLRLLLQCFQNSGDSLPSRIKLRYSLDLLSGTEVSNPHDLA